MRHHLEQAFYALTALLSQYGWHIVIGLLVMRYLYRKGTEQYLLMQQRKAFREATDPVRVAALKREEDRVRDLQQRSYLSLAEEKQKEDRAKAIAKAAAQGEEQEEDGTDGFNHLAPPAEKGIRFSRACGTGG